MSPLLVQWLYQTKVLVIIKFHVRANITIDRILFSGYTFRCPSCSCSRMKVFRQICYIQNYDTPKHLLRTLLVKCQSTSAVVNCEKKQQNRTAKKEKLDEYNSTEYYFENGFRKVYPFFFTFESNCKESWVGRSLVDVLAQFPPHTQEAFSERINLGMVTVNDRIETRDYKLWHNDRIKHTVHRHELPVFGTKSIEFIHQCNDLLVVNKPASIPVHPTGRYRYNTLQVILAKEYKILGVKGTHRLDRLTTGLLIFALSSKKASLIGRQFQNGLIEKEYLCRADGNFPDGGVSCNKPIRYLNRSFGVCSPGPHAKDCATDFQKLSYNGKTSLILCRPKTGRTHQIRIHLQYLGYPISNDPVYNIIEIFGNNRGKFGNYQKTDVELVNSYIKYCGNVYWFGYPTSERDGHHKCFQNQNELENKENLNGLDSSYPKFDPSKMTYDPHCCDCKQSAPDPRKENLVMYLHAVKYKGPDWIYETPKPYWAQDNFML